MNEKIFEILEYDRIRQMLEKFATSEPGREICRQLMPETEIETIKHLVDETTAARERITHKGKPSFAKVTNLDRILDSLENGNSLTAGDLLKIYDLLDGTSKAKDYGCREISEEEKDLLDGRFNQLSPLKKIQEEIKRCIRNENDLHDMGMSWAVKEYLESTEFINVSEELYTSAVFTCGKSCGIAAEEMKEVLQQKGLSINATYAVCMPDNYIPMFPLVSEKKQKKILDKAECTIETVISKIQNHDSAFEMPPAMPKPMAKLVRKINIPKQKKTDHFWVKDSCNGCHLCEQICPMNIIEIQNGKPVWTKDGCACCLGCIHRCPKQAIQYGKKTESRGRYTNPNVTL